MGSLSLHFLDFGLPEVSRITFEHSSIAEKRTIVRGKSGEAHGTKNTFQWTAALKALSILLLRNAAACFAAHSSKIEPVVLEGGVGSPAVTLDYALDKHTQSLIDIFGADSKGRSLAERFFKRSNRSRKMPGPVRIGLNTNMLTGKDIEVYVRDEKVTDPETLAQLAAEIEKLWQGKRKSVVVNKVSDESTGAPLIRPATEQDIDEIYENESREFPGDHASKERLEEWRRHDPHNFMCISYPNEPLMGYYLVLFPTRKAIEELKEGTLLEDDILPSDLVAADEKAYLASESAFVVVVASMLHFSFLTGDLIWHLMSRVLELAKKGKLKTLYAEISTKHGERFVRKLGFRPYEIAGGRRSGPIFELELNEATIAKFAARFKSRTLF